MGGLGITREQADFAVIWLPGRVLVGLGVSEVREGFVTSPATALRSGRLRVLDELGIKNEFSRFIVTQAEVDDSLQKRGARIVKDRVRPIVAARNDSLVLQHQD
jgi:hypothetical protein